MDYHLVPNWSAGVRETYEFKTTIFTTRSGKEQRSAERLKPRRTVSFDGVVYGDYMRDLQGLLHDRGSATITIPDPARYGAILIEDAPAGATSIRLDHLPNWLEPGVSVAISDTWQSEFRTLGAIEQSGAFSTAFDESFDRLRRSRVFLTQPLARSWPPGTAVRPTITGHLQQQFTATYPTNSVMRYTADVALLPPTDMPEITNAPELPTFESLPVLDVPPNWVNPPSVQFLTPFETVDYGRGVTRHYLAIDFFTRISQLNFAGISRDRVGAIFRLFNWARGRQKEFWCPTWIEDMVPNSGIEAGSSLLTVGLDAQRYRNSTVNRVIAIELHDGAIWYRRITGMQAVVGGGLGAFSDAFSPAFDTQGTGIYTRLTLNEPFPRSVRQSEISRISWLNRSRFATDILTAEWLTDDAVRMVAQIMSLEDL